MIHPADRAERDELAKRLIADSVDHAEADRRLLRRNGDTVMVHSFSDGRLAMLGVNGLTLVNDSFGHAAGD